MTRPSIAFFKPRGLKDHSFNPWSDIGIDRSYHHSLCDIERHTFVSRKDSAVFYHYILIGNHAIQEHVFSRKGILKQYAVFNNTALADLYSSEQDRVFNSSLDYTAIGDYRVLNARIVHIACRCRVAYLSVYRTVLNGEQFLSDICAKQLHRAAEIAFKRIYKSKRTFITVYFVFHFTTL